MRSISGALSTALNAPVQQPAILVQANFATIRRWSSFATTPWNGQTWTLEDIAVQDLQIDALRVRGTLIIGNADDAAGSLVLAENPADVPITIWGYDAAATATADVVHLCDAVGAGARIDGRSVAISLRSASEFLLAPRQFVGPTTGFNTLLPAGTVLKINGIDYRLERRA
jgi:hypothetical protein